MDKRSYCSTIKKIIRVDHGIEGDLVSGSRGLLLTKVVSTICDGSLFGRIRPLFGLPEVLREK